MKGDILRRMIGRRRHRHRGKHRLRIQGGPGQCLHAAHRPADHREQPRNSQMVHQPLLRPHHVLNGHRRKFRPPGLERPLIMRGSRPGRAHAAAQHIGADHEIPVRIHRLARPHHRLPPARLARQRMHLCHILVAGQRMADQHRIAALGIQRPVAAIGHRQARQMAPAIQRQPILETDRLVHGFRLCRTLIHDRADMRPP